MFYSLVAFISYNSLILFSRWIGCVDFIKEKLSENNFGIATNFFRNAPNVHQNIYHHVGIYAFTNKALVRYVSLERSKLELERKLEQLRALENNMRIDVGYIKSSPLSVDTEEDLEEVKKLMNKNEKN